jgi:hypothetical protein
MRLICGWLEVGVMDNGHWLYPEAGTPQGGVISPLLANIALHGLETAVERLSTRKHPVVVVRYADDLVALSDDLDTLWQAQAIAAEWLAPRGLQFKANKTRTPSQSVDTVETCSEGTGFYQARSLDSTRPHLTSRTLPITSSTCTSRTISHASLLPVCESIRLLPDSYPA